MSGGPTVAGVVSRRRGVCKSARVKVTMLLADFAQVADGKLTVVGGGWSLTGPEPTPFGIAILVHVPWDQANRRHTLRLELVDADGQPVTFPVDEARRRSGRSSSSTMSSSRSDAPAGIKPGTPLELPLAVNSGPLPLEPGGRYEWRLSIDGDGDEDWRLAFSVRLEEERPSSAVSAVGTVSAHGLGRPVPGRQQSIGQMSWLAANRPTTRRPARSPSRSSISSRIIAHERGVGPRARGADEPQARARRPSPRASMSRSKSTSRWSETNPIGEITTSVTPRAATASR